ncbi:GH92 family glycosyl hydrolase [Paraflavitalea sp. CAU 1676]|uniref:GH92 family glycosyl hydrolase n=1 Tax=Paraflavitalea sp. CAU 1676 TaxID=3032598 RepID=UPI0023DC616D|nr:GH92 family glycosyl hydrolase [Paraflavitalea sp. CAU 1676]MDF2187846.1 GH92 family glycosyl hydrolase [Paraflavitalea sp. CAU 1676]
MKKTLLIVVLICNVTVLMARQPAKAAFINPDRSVLGFLDPTIGNVGQLLEPTRPTIQLPNQMIRVAPQRKDYLDNQISSFPLNIVSHRLGQVFSIKPSVKPVARESWQARMTYDHDLEVNNPWHYATWLIDDEVGVEFTPGRKAGVYRFRFPASAHKALLFDVYNGDEAQYNFPSATEITGYETWHGDVKVYLYGVFSVAGKPGVLVDGQVQNTNTITGRGVKAFLSFPTTTGEVELRYAISYVSADQAKKNYEQELKGKSFAAIADNGKRIWEETLTQIKVEGGTEAQKRSFYTALYRCYERMVDVSENDQYYSGYNKQINKDKRPFYVDDWAWDTYLAHHPLRMILHPKQEEDMLQSYVRMYEQSGWMPTFPVLFGDHACMNGFHSSVVVLDAWRKGLRNFDIQKAYEGMRKNATDATIIPWRNGPKTALDDFYHSKGYFPALAPGDKETEALVDKFEKRQAVAVTLGTSYDDWALAQLAKDLNKQDDYQRFSARGLNYKNLWHPEKKFFLPKDDKGNWINIDLKFDGGPGGRDYYDENNGWTYLWQVQQDIPGLIDLMGGKQVFENRLDQLYREGLGRGKHEFWNKFPDATGLVGQFSMGNEPSFHIPYLYNFTGSPWKTQKTTRFLLDVWFRDNVFGIPGDEDGGGMTAFVVFSSMGFYPVTPGLPVYTIGSPLFSKVTIDLQNGKQFRLTANNCSVVNKYIQSAKMNGVVLNTPWFTHDQLMSGGHLELEMGPKPNKSWGTGSAGF